MTHSAAALPLLTLLAQACAIHFVPPAQPGLPAPSAPAAAPVPVTVTSARVPVAHDEIAGGLRPAEVRDGALGLIATGGASAEVERAPGVEVLLRRLLATPGARVVDLTGARELAASVERSGKEERVGLGGRLDRMLWTARLVPPRLILFIDALDVRAVSRPAGRRLRFEEGQIAAYESRLHAWVEGCRSISAEVERARGAYSGEWDRKEEQYLRERPWWWPLGTETAHKEALLAQKRWHGRAVSLIEACKEAPTEPQSLRARDGSETEPASVEVAEAELRFRVIEVPGGRVASAGRIVREGSSPELALADAVERLVSALYGAEQKGGKRR